MLDSNSYLLRIIETKDLYEFETDEYYEFSGPVQKFLSLPVFNVMAKLTYSMYLVHLIVILSMNAASKTILHFSNMNVLILFFAYFSVTFLISIFYSLIFESPMVTIIRIMFPNPKEKGSGKELPK